MNPLMVKFLASAIRHGLTAGGAILVAQGYASEADVTSFAASGSMILAGLAWSLWQKYAESQRPS